MKTGRGRGGGAEHVLFQGITGNVGTALQINMGYGKQVERTNASATPQFRDIMVRDTVSSQNVLPL